MLKFVAPLFIALAPLPTVAAAQEQTVQVRVEYRDLNLKNPAGVAQLDHRIAKAVTEVCPAARAGDLSARIRERRCRSVTLAAVNPQRARVLAGGLAQPAMIALY